jgi:hypothetical protein
VRIEGNGISEFNAVEEVASLFRTGPGKEAAPARVNVMPDVVLLGDSIDCNGVIEATESGSAGK